MTAAERNHRIAIGIRISQGRRLLSLSQRDLGDMIGAHGNQVSTWETGKSAPTVSALARLSKALGMSIDWIVTGEEWEAST